MFNMKKNAEGQDGYQLIIRYNAKMDMYFLTGYTMRMSDTGSRMTIDADGATLQFPSLEMAIAHITNYKDN